MDFEVSAHILGMHKMQDQLQKLINHLKLKKKLHNAAFHTQKAIPNQCIGRTGSIQA